MQETVIRFHVKLLVSLCCVLVLASILTFSRASAQVETTQGGTVVQPTLQVAVATGDSTRLDFWVPALITINNNGPDFTGVLAVTTYTGRNPCGPSAAGVLGWSYRQIVSVKHGAQKQVTINVPFYESPSIPCGIIASLLNMQGKAVAFNTDVPSKIDYGSIMIGILADQTTQNGGFTPLSAATLPDQSRQLTLVPLDATSLPDTAETLAPFDILVLDNFPTGSLSAAQITALRTWVNRGGALIEIGGQQRQQALGALPRRWVMERSFAWMARFRRLARDYERLPETLAGLHLLAFVVLMLHRFTLLMAHCP